MTLLARVVFGLLVGATFSAFFVAQRLKGEPPVLGAPTVQKYFSPNGDGRRDVEDIAFGLKEADDLTVDVVDADGGRVRRLLSGRATGSYSRVALAWNGRTDEGARAPDGRYRIRVSLRRRGRSVVVPDAIELDTRPPVPRIARARARGTAYARRGPAIALPGQPVDLSVRRVGRRRATDFAVYRTDHGKPRVVARFESPAPGAHRATWDGLVDSRPAPVGTYLVVPTAEDRAGNRGSTPAELPPQRGTILGRPGIVVRRLAVAPPLEPVRAGERAQFLVDSRGRDYTWNVRRVGDSRRLARGAGRPGGPLLVRAPRRSSGVYLLQVRAGPYATRVPFLVQSAKRERILVVLPAITWLGTDSIDDDGDGLPDALADGAPVRRDRPLTGLPVGFAGLSAPLLAELDRIGVRYDVTTDLALLRTNDPSPTDREGVLLAGPERWIPRSLGARLRRYVERGGRVATFGADALRRGVTVRAGRLIRPTQPTDTDVFGARLRPLRRLDGPAPLVTLADDPKLGLLEGVSDVVDGFEQLEESVPARDGRLKLFAGIGRELGERAPIDPETGLPQAPLPALAGSRLGKGLVIRVGLPEWGVRLRSDAGVQQITGNVADLLRRARPRPRDPSR